MVDDIMNLTDEQSNILQEFIAASTKSIIEKLQMLLERNVTPFDPELFAATPEEAANALDLPVCAVSADYSNILSGTEFFIFNQADINVFLDLIAGLEITEISEETEFDELRKAAAGEFIESLIHESNKAVSNSVKVDMQPVLSPLVVGNGYDLLSPLTDDIVVIYTDITVSGFEPLRFARVITAPLVSGLFLAHLANVQYAEMSSANVIMADSHPTPPPPAQNNEPVIHKPQSVPEPPLTETPTVNAKKLVVTESNIPNYVPFDDPSIKERESREVMGIITDVPLQITAELGRTRCSVDDILAFEVGSVIMLDKLAGDPIEVLINGRLTARGEVVVFDDTLAVRIIEFVQQR